MEAKKLKIYDISDVSPAITAGGDDMGSQVAPDTEVGVFLKTIDPKLSTRYAKTLFDAGFETMRDLAIEVELLIAHTELLPGHAIKVSQAAIEALTGKPGTIAEGTKGLESSEVDMRRLAGSAPSFPNDSIPSRSKVENWWAQTISWSRLWSNDVANYLVELKSNVNEGKVIYDRYSFTIEQNNYGGNKLMQAFERSDHVMSLFTRTQKDKPTLMTLMTIIAHTHFPRDEFFLNTMRSKFNEFPSCKDKTKLLGQYNSWCDLHDELESMGQMVVQDEEAVIASFKRLIRNIDELQQVINMGDKLMDKKFGIDELKEITKREAIPWARQSEGKPKPNPTTHPNPKPHDKPHEPKPKEHKGYVGERDKLEVCGNWAIERLPSCGHEEDGKCRLGFTNHPPHMKNSNPKEILDKYKSIPCKNWKAGKCRFEDDCLFGHQ